MKKYIIATILVLICLVGTVSIFTITHLEEANKVSEPKTTEFTNSIPSKKSEITSEEVTGEQKTEPTTTNKTVETKKTSEVNTTKKETTRKTATSKKQESTKKPTAVKTTTEKKTIQDTCLTELEKDVPLYYDLGCGMRAEDASFKLAPHFSQKKDELIRLKALEQELITCSEAYSAVCRDSLNAQYITIKGTKNNLLRGYAVKVNIFRFENSERVPLAEGYIKSDNTLQWIYKKY